MKTAEQWLKEYLGEPVGPNDDMYHITVGQITQLLRTWGKQVLIEAANRAETCTKYIPGASNEMQVQVDKTSITAIIDQL